MGFALKMTSFPPVLVKMCITLRYSVPYMEPNVLLLFYQPSLALLCRNSLTCYFLSANMWLQVIKIKLNVIESLKKV